MGTISAHLPDNWDLEKLFNDKVKRDYRGKPGRYILALLEKDLSAEASGVSFSKLKTSQITRWIEDEAILLTAGRLALNMLAASTPEIREKIGIELATVILKASLRATTSEALEMINQATGRTVFSSEMLDTLKAKEGPNFKDTLAKWRASLEEATSGTLQEIPGEKPESKNIAPLSPDFTPGKSTHDKTKPAKARHRKKPNLGEETGQETG
jgi:hypothetical protein